MRISDWSSDVCSSDLDLQFFGWVDQHHSDLGKVRSESIRLVKAAFTHAGIHPPRTVYHVVTSRDAEPPPEHAAVEPPHAANVHASVNRAIDAQLADAPRPQAPATAHLLHHQPRLTCSRQRRYTLATNQGVPAHFQKTQL